MGNANAAITSPSRMNDGSVKLISPAPARGSTSVNTGTSAGRQRNVWKSSETSRAPSAATAAVWSHVSSRSPEPLGRIDQYASAPWK